MIPKQPFKLNDLQNRPLVIALALLISFSTGFAKWAFNRMDRKDAECREDQRAERAKSDSVNHIIYLEYRREVQRNQNSDSILRAKTQKEVEEILNKKHE